MFEYGDSKIRDLRRRASVGDRLAAIELRQIEKRSGNWKRTRLKRKADLLDRALHKIPVGFWWQLYRRDFQNQEVLELLTYCARQPATTTKNTEKYTVYWTRGLTRPQDRGMLVQRKIFRLGPIPEYEITASTPITRQELSFNRLYYARSRICPGAHYGNGSRNCPRELHHHHDHHDTCCGVPGTIEIVLQKFLPIRTRQLGVRYVMA